MLLPVWCSLIPLTVPSGKTPCCCASEMAVLVLLLTGLVMLLRAEGFSGASIFALYVPLRCHLVFVQDSN